MRPTPISVFGECKAAIVRSVCDSFIIICLPYCHSESGASCWTADDGTVGTRESARSSGLSRKCCIDRGMDLHGAREKKLNKYYIIAN